MWIYSNIWKSLGVNPEDKSGAGDIYVAYSSQRYILAEPNWLIVFVFFLTMNIRSVSGVTKVGDIYVAYSTQRYILAEPATQLIPNRSKYLLILWTLDKSAAQRRTKCREDDIVPTIANAQLIIYKIIQSPSSTDKDQRETIRSTK